MQNFKRTLFRIVEAHLPRTPLIELYGPRRSGKTTLLRTLPIEGEPRYISLRDPRMGAIAREHPDSFLDLNSPPVFFDDIESCPELLEAILMRIPEDPGPCQYLVAGTTEPVTTHKADSSLRKIFRLFPMSLREIAGYPDSVFYWEQGPHNQSGFLAGLFLWNTFLKNGFPELVAGQDINFKDFYSGYLSDYLKKDVISLRKKAATEPFRDFMILLAERAGEPLNLSDMARQVHTTLHIVKMWLAILERTHQIYILPSFNGRNRSTLIKASKAYYTNTGLLCYLLGLTDPKKISSSFRAPAILETAVINEIVRTKYHRSEDPGISFWRKATGMEVSLVLQDQEELVAIETSTSSKPQSNMSKGIRFFRKEMSIPGIRGYVINPGKSAIPLSEGVEALPMGNM